MVAPEFIYKKTGATALFRDSHYFIRGVLGEKCQKSASLTLSRYILKSIQRRDTHNNDSYGRCLSNDVIYIWLPLELIPRDVFKVGEVSEMMCFLEMYKFWNVCWGERKERKTASKVGKMAWAWRYENFDFAQTLLNRPKTMCVE